MNVFRLILAHGKALYIRNLKNALLWVSFDQILPNSFNNGEKNEKSLLLLENCVLVPSVLLGAVSEIQTN